MSIRSNSSHMGIVDQHLLYQEIADYQSKIQDVVNKTYWPVIESARKASFFFKIASMKISYAYVKLADYNYSLIDCHDTADDQWQEALKNLKACSDYQCEKEDLNYQNWFDISTLYAKRLQLSARQIRVISPQETVDFLREGLAAVNSAIQIERKPETLYRKFMFLKMLEEMNEQVPESPMNCWREYLDHHPDHSSSDYLENAQLYGGELAKRGNLKEAQEWFLKLEEKGPHPITCLYLGKVEDHLGQSEQALSYFQRANGLDPNNLEIQLWLVSHRAKKIIQDIRAGKVAPSKAKVQEMVNVFNEFCSVFPNCAPHLKAQTSTFIPLEDLANHFYITHVLDMAHILAQCQQYQFSLHLYERILELFDGFVAVGALNPSDKMKIYTSIGAIYLQQNSWDQAEGSLVKALEINPAYAPALENLVAVYASQKDEAKISQLWAQVEPLLPAIKLDEQSTYSSVLFNFGTAYALMGRDWLQNAQEFYEKSLELDHDNWDTRIHWARILAITENFSKAAQLLSGYESRVSAGESFFGESPFRDFQVYFCRAGIQAIKGDLKEAEQSTILAGKTHCNPDETINLRTHLYNLRQQGPNTEELHRQILESIRKMEFTFRIGKVLNKRSITFRENDFVGYHGTVDTYVNDFKDGVKPKRSTIRQFKGEGFYIAPDLEIACYFAMKKQKDEKRGTPIILRVYANKPLVGNHTVTNKREQNYYDFFHASIDGFEKFSQFYVQEESLKKLRIAENHESVDWTEDDYTKFMNSWARTRCI